MIARILCPLTLSDASRRTFEHALAMGRCYRANVIALHVFARWIPPGGLGTYPGWMRQVPEARIQIDRELHDLLEPATETDLDVRLTVREGNPAREILEAAATCRADLIVLGARATRPGKWLARESITETVVRNSTSPVLVVAGHGVAGLPPFTGYRRVVSPTDVSDHSRAALPYAVSIAERAAASLTLLHVIETNDAPSTLNTGGPADTQRGAQFEAARGFLRTTVKDYGERRCEISDIVRAGVPAREIVRLVREIEADLIVMGVRGTRTMDPKRAGSTTTQVMKCAPCAVLTVARPDRHEGPTA